MRILARLSLFCLALSSSLASAALLPNLYQVREPVDSQAPDERNAALSRAFEALLLRLTGDAGALQKGELAALRSDPQRVISVYGYDGQDLVVDFDPASISRLLRQAGLPQWGANRPVVLTWWLNAEHDGQALVGDAQSAAEALQRAARHRGLPLRLPLADLEEQLAITADSLFQADGLRQASERYAADALLAVEALEEDGHWRARWSLWLGDSHEQGSAEGDDDYAVADAVLLAAAQHLARHFAVSASATSLTLEVQDSDLAHYAELERLLEPFGGQLLKVSEDRLLYRVNASAEQLRAQLQLSQLREVQVQEGEADDGILRFRW